MRNRRPAPLTDVSRFPLGRPRQVLFPRSERGVLEAVAAARRRGRPLVAVGRLTAYWRPIDASEAVVLDTGGLRGLGFSSGAAWIGAGVPVREADRALRARGYHLPIHPDAYGDTPIGAMAASACTSGVGMANGPLSRWLCGLAVVTGQPRLLTTGAACLRGVPPFSRDGLPDPTGLFLGSEGALGVVTRLAVRLQPPPYRVRVRGRGGLACGRALAPLARELGRAGLYDTFRAALTLEAGVLRGWEVDAWAQSFWSPEEALARGRELAARLGRALGGPVSLAAEPELARRGRGPEYDARWLGRPRDHALMARRAHFLGVDVNAPYEEAGRALAAALACLAQLRRARAPQARAALYFAPDFVNVGVHASLPARPADFESHWALQRRWLSRFSALDVVPYRFGRLWPRRMTGRLEPETARFYLELKRWLDPDGILNPGYPLFSGEAA